MTEHIEVRADDLDEDGGEYDVLSVVAVPGAAVSAGDVLLELATDKANVEITAETGATVAAVHVTEGDVVAPGQVLVVLEVR